MTSNYLTTEDLDGKETRGFILRRNRSVSLNNIAYTDADDADVTIHEEKSNFLRSGGDRLKGLKKKLNIKLSKSNTDLAAHNVNNTGINNPKDSNKLDLSEYHLNNADPRKSPRDARKIYKEQKKRSKTGLSTDSLCDLSSSKSSSKSNDKLFQLYSSASDTLDLSYPVSEPSLNYEYLDDLGSCEHDETDSAVLPREQIEKLWRKIEKIREDLVQLQAIRDENVAEYLKNTDNNSIDYAKVKINFEKSNQKTNISIHLLQKKLDKYVQQVKEIEENGGVHGTKRIMKVVQDSVHSGASSIKGAVSKPLESFNNFRKKDKKISSTENVYITVTDDEKSELERLFEPKYIGPGLGYMRNESVDNNMNDEYNNLEAIEAIEVDALKGRIVQLEKENEDSKVNIAQFKEQLNYVVQSLQDESYKTVHLETRLYDLFNQWNELTELHQNEMMEMKDEMNHTMERIECVEYRFTERTGDLEENLDKCATKISKIEKQQHEQQPSIDIDAKSLFSKFLKFVVNICVLTIYVLSSITKMIMPFVSNRVRLLATGVALIAFILVWKNLDHDIFNVCRNLFLSRRNEINVNFKT